MGEWVDTAKDRAEMLKAQTDYGSAIRAWLTRCLPDVGAHPAAVAAVIRLHYLHGRGSLTVAEHGPVICEAVATWEQKWTTTAAQQEAS